jgi:hypothetical protein
MSTPYNEYTKEDLLLLNNMVDTNIDNPNLHYPLKTYEDEQGIYRLFSREVIDSETYEYILKSFINFLTPDWGITFPEIIDLINVVSLENMPLYLNCTSNHGLIARWRLQIGK